MIFLCAIETVPYHTELCAIHKKNASRNKRKVMRILLLLLSMSTSIALTAIRGYSTVWKNHKDEVVKRVVYGDAHTRLSKSFANEAAALNALPKYWEYEAIAVKGVPKLLIRRLKPM